MSTRPGPARFAGDPYQVLGVDRGADAREIRAAYRALAKIHHPDVDKSAGAAERMARINWAYKIAIEHARHEGPRVYRGTTHAGGQRTRPKWYVRQRPPPQGGKLVAITRTVRLRGLRGENANVEGLVVVENQGTGPLEGEARATPAWVIVSPKQFTLEPHGSQMFRVSAPNRYCGEDVVKANLVFESNGGDDRVTLELPQVGEVLVALEPSTLDMGEMAPGETRIARLRLSYRGKGLPRMLVESSEPWLDVRPISFPRRTQYYRATVVAPLASGPTSAHVTATVGAARATTTVLLNVLEPTEGEIEPAP